MRMLFESLKVRNEPLFIFGIVCFAAGLLCLVLVKAYPQQILGTSAWFKPAKFFLSSGILSWTMAWYLHHLGQSTSATIYAWVLMVILAAETIYIFLQAAKGEPSHFNKTSTTYGILFQLMAILAVVLTLWTAYIGVLFFRHELADAPAAYAWGIRWGIVVFVIFALEGLVMGALMAHTVGAPDGGRGLPVLNWSTRHGDLRVAHFMGMHALQVLPLLSCYVFKSVKGITMAAVAYFIITTVLFVQALQGKPLIRL